MSEQTNTTSAGYHVDPVKAPALISFELVLREAHGHVLLQWTTNCPVRLEKGEVCLFKGPVTPKPGTPTASTPFSSQNGEFETKVDYGSGWYAAIVADGFSGGREYVVVTPATVAKK